MGNRVYIHGKSVKRSQLTPIQVEIEELLTEEKRLTREWYLKMSGEMPWGNTSRAEYASRFESIEGSVRALQAGETARWFSTLASG